MASLITSTANLLIAVAILISAAEAYTNHTVGGGVGWFFNRTSNTSATVYSQWAASQTFNLGDFLIFNTNSNQTVIQTYNKTTYKACDADDAEDDDTSVYSAGDLVKEALTLSVPLTIEGPNYYFSGADDGAQCEQGMAFEIAVKHGQGLPPSLSQPPPPPYVSPPSPEGSDSPPSAVPTGQQESFYKNGGANVRMCLTVPLLLVTWLLISSVF